ncbi:MAG: FAD-binding protein [Myxococcales bacterium]|nr:FAD-binding protein [Myxococcales bacterium]
MKTLAEILERALPRCIQQGRDETLLLPSTESDIALALELAAAQGARISPPGAAPVEGAIRLDLRRMQDILSVDEISRIVHVQAGATLAAVETTLRRRSLTLGMAAESLEPPIGEWIAGGTRGGRSGEDDPIDQMIAGLQAVLADGRALRIRPAPRRAVGPDLLAAIRGSGGRIAIVTAVHLVARARLDSKELAFLFAEPNAAEATLAWIRGEGVFPARSALIPTAEGMALRIWLEAKGGILAARETLVRRLAEARGGVGIEPAEAPPIPSEAAPAVSGIVEALAKRLDPSGVLGA